jgi:hypothetical protein
VKVEFLIVMLCVMVLLFMIVRVLVVAQQYMMHVVFVKVMALLVIHV